MKLYARFLNPYCKGPSLQGFPEPKLVALYGPDYRCHDDMADKELWNCMVQEMDPMGTLVIKEYFEVVGNVDI